MVLFPVAGAGLVDNKAQDRHDERMKEGRNAERELQGMENQERWALWRGSAEADFEG